VSLKKKASYDEYQKEEDTGLVGICGTSISNPGAGNLPIGPMSRGKYPWYAWLILAASLATIGIIWTLLFLR